MSKLDKKAQAAGAEANQPTVLSALPANLPNFLDLIKTLRQEQALTGELTEEQEKQIAVVCSVVFEEGFFTGRTRTLQ